MKLGELRKALYGTGANRFIEEDVKSAGGIVPAMECVERQSHRLGIDQFLPAARVYNIKMETRKCRGRQRES